MIFACYLSVLKVLEKTIAQNIYWEIFCNLSKIHENHKLFSHVTFAVYGIIILLQ